MIITLALVGVLLAAISGPVAALAGSSRPRTSTALHVGTMIAGCVLGTTAAAGVLAGYGTATWSSEWAVPAGQFAIRIDPIAAIFLIQVLLLGAMGTIYGVGYWPIAKHPDDTGRLRTFSGLLVAGMAVLLMANNSILFLFGWEIMALAAFFALTTEDRNSATREAGLVYLVATHVGTLALMAMFALLHVATSSYALSPSGLDATSPIATAIFCLGLLGFGLKAGVMPLHLWLPGAHANAPTHVSAVMSGVMIKMGIYGLVRLSSFFHHVPLWWGIVVFGLGAISAVLGVAFALGQHDLKRLLAYHSVENIGIIVMSLGVALLGRSLARQDLVVLGLAGALLHTFNHGLFKALLFFCAGSVIHCTKTREIDLMGGLARRLPYTAAAFLIGATAICGLPPLNGFISELFLYLGMLRAGVMGNSSVGTMLLFGVPVLALVGALAVACFAKVHGIVFLGEPRRGMDPNAHESPVSMLVPMATLALGCVVIGTMPLLVTPTLELAIDAWHGSPHGAALSTLIPFKSLMWANLCLLLAVAGVAALLKLRLPKARVATGPTWDCGYLAPSPRMQYTASSFADWLVCLFASVLRPHASSPKLVEPFPSKSHFESHVPEVVLELAVMPSLGWLIRTANWFRWIQPGSIHLYIVFILVTLVVMLFVWR